LDWVEPPTLDPALAFYTASEGVIDQLFSGLVAATPELDVVPDMARSWEVFEGGRKYVFHLRDDVCYSDGAPVTAGDFECAWKRALDPVIGSIFAGVLYVVKGARDFHQRKGRSQDVGVRAVNEATLMVELEEPTGYFLQLLAHHRTYPVPRHVVKVHGEAWTEAGKLVTCGPFELEAWKPGESIRLSRNPDQARRLLAEAGWPDGRGFPIVKALQTPRADSRCEYLKAQWEENLGVEVRFETLEFMAVRYRLDHEPPHMYVMNWGADFPDPDNVLRASPFRQSTRWRNEAYERLLEEASRVMDQAERMNLYRQADRILVEEAPLIPLTYDRTHLLVKPWVSRYPTTGIRWWFWKDVVIEPH
jgi:ABC-type oligopeptide transport system substrate-binding subunit